MILSHKIIPNYRHIPDQGTLHSHQYYFQTRLQFKDSLYQYRKGAADDSGRERWADLSDGLAFGHLCARIT